MQFSSHSRGPILPSVHGRTAAIPSGHTTGFLLVCRGQGIRVANTPMIHSLLMERMSTCPVLMQRPSEVFPICQSMHHHLQLFMKRNLWWTTLLWASRCVRQFVGWMHWTSVRSFRAERRDEAAQCSGWKLFIIVEKKKTSLWVSTVRSLGTRGVATLVGWTTNSEGSAYLCVTVHGSLQSTQSLGATSLTARTWVLGLTNQLPSHPVSGHDASMVLQLTMPPVNSVTRARQRSLSPRRLRDQRSTRQ